MANDTCNMNGTLAGKVAVVTGASRGIGEAICYRLAMEGARVVPSARTAQPSDHIFDGTINETADRILECGGDAFAVQCNLASSEDRENLIRETQEHYGPVDILVSNAAITYFIPVLEFPGKRYDLMFEVQVKAPFHLVQMVLPSMIERSSGHIVNISSGAAFHPEADAPGGHGGTIYGMCKAALERFTTGLAQEQYNNNVSINVISPGLVATPGVVHHHLINESNKARVQAVEYIAESVYQLTISDISMSGRIDHAAAFLEELKIEPSETLKDFPQTA
ncbi:MAG: SDR family NAD(P)-dependent oxidoreductase [Gammaproteobacteria bacterium]|nr:SDR family NAD(P)-dependent oxidoreductase [Gammaproteobacteria bacterium]